MQDHFPFPVPANESERLAALQAYDILDTVPEPSFDRIAAMAARLFKAPIALVSLVADGRQWFKARCGLEATETSRTLSFCAHAMFESEPTVVCDATRDTRFQNNPLVTGPMSIRFYAGAPLRTPDGLPLGTLCVIDTIARQAPPQELLDCLEDLAFLVIEQLEFRSAIAAERRAQAERRMAQEIVRTTAAQLEEAQRLAHLGSWEFDLRTNAISWSDETYRLFGMPPQSTVSYDAYLGLLSEAEKHKMETVVRNCIETGVPYCVTHKLTRADGALLHLEGRGRIERDSEGRPAKLLGTVLDVTVRVQADLLLRQSNEELEQRVQRRTELLAQSNAALLEEIEQHKLTQHLVSGQNRVLRKIAVGAPLAEVFETLLQSGHHDTGEPIHGGILLKTECGDSLRWVCAPTIPSEILDAMPEIKIGPNNGTAAGAACLRRPVVLTDLEKSSWPGAALFSKYLKARSLASTPILDSNNEVLGTVSFACRGDRPTEYEMRIQEACASVAAMALLRDKAQARLRQWEQMFQHASWGMALASAQTGKLLMMNPAYARMLGCAEEELEGRSVFDVDGQQLMSSTLLEPGCFVYKTHLSYESRWTRNDGTKFPVWIDIVPISDPSGQSLYWAANVRDITAQQKATVQLHEALRQYQFLADFIPQIVWTAGADGGINYCNEKWRSYTSLSIEQSQGWAWKELVHPDDLQNCVSLRADSLTTGQPYEAEVRLKRAGDGIYRWHLTRAVPFKSAAGEIIKWFGTCTDIHEQKTETERLETEVAAGTTDLRRSLTEKETLLKEVHHRVKNNLQVISSLLRMQAASLKDPCAAAALKESQHRVMSMALIHERLYSRQMHEIDFGNYMRSLVQELFHSYALGAVGVVSRIDTVPVLLNIDQAIPCGLILNELVTNALKYAYPAGSEGEVLIELLPTGPGRLRLTVSDEGVGLPANWVADQATSLGLPIVDLLAKQLGGRLEIRSGSGAAFSVEFPVEANITKTICSAA